MVLSLLFPLHSWYCYVQTESNTLRAQGIGGKRLYEGNGRIPAELRQISSRHWTRLPKWKWPECQDGKTRHKSHFNIPLVIKCTLKMYTCITFPNFKTWNHQFLSYHSKSYIILVDDMENTEIIMTQFSFLVHYCPWFGWRDPGYAR
jgi:hypothetical protein